MKKYPTYKPSVVEWIGEIPLSWDSIRLKNIGFLYGGLSGKSGRDFKQEDNPNNKPFIPFTNISDNTYISQDNLGRVVILDDEDQNVVKQFDLFFLMSSETQEDVGKSSALKDDIGEVYLNSFCRGFRINNEELSPLFINYLLGGHAYRELLSVEGKGFTRINLRSHKITDLKVYYPPLPEQHQIVEYLDQKTSIIDDLIQKKLRKIELLKDQRTSLINHTVTKGLNPDVKMKDSGVEWIGEIPEHWEKKRIKYLGETLIGLSFKPDVIVEEGEGVLVLRASNIQNGEPTFIDNVYVNIKIPDKLLVREGDILICSRSGSKDLIGKNMMISKNLEGMTFGVFMTILRSKENKFLFWFLNSQLFFNQSSLFLTSTINQLTLSTLNNFLIPFPNMGDERDQIFQYLTVQTQVIDKSIEKEQRNIDLLKEYRQSLISEVVTGKIDVRKN